MSLVVNNITSLARFTLIEEFFSFQLRDILTRARTGYRGRVDLSSLLYSFFHFNQLYDMTSYLRVRILNLKIYLRFYDQLTIIISLFHYFSPRNVCGLFFCKLLVIFVIFVNFCNFCNFLSVNFVFLYFCILCNFCTLCKFCNLYKFRNF